MLISRETSPVSPYLNHKHAKKSLNLVGVDKVEIINEKDKLIESKAPAKKGDQNFLNDVQRALNRLKDIPISKPKYQVEII